MINSASKSDQTYTVTQYIDMKSSDSNTYHNYSVLGYLKGIEYPITNLLYDYQEELEEASQYLVMTDSEFVKYKYKPWLLAYDIYGSEQMEFIIYTLNDILCDREFDFKRVRILKCEYVNTILGRIYSANLNFINNNRSDIALEEKNDKTMENMVW